MSQRTRYIICIPVGFIAAILVTFPVHWVVLMITSCQSEGVILDEHGCYRSLWTLVDAESLERIGYGVFEPIAFLFTATNIARSYSKRFVISLTGIWLLFAIGAFSLLLPEWIEFRRYVKFSEWLAFGAVPVAHLTSATLTAKLILKERLTRSYQIETPG